MIIIEIELNNMQEIRYDKDEEVVEIKYTSSLDRNRKPVEVDVSDENEAHKVIREVSEARKKFLEDPDEDTITLDID